MKSVVELEINATRDRVAALFSDPRNMVKWMDDMDYEPLTGPQGEPGSTYHLGQRDGMWFTATVLAKNLPKEMQLRLDLPDLEVAITDKFVALPSGHTKLTSTEDFRWKGILSRLKGVFARGAMKRAHRRHMESFKQYAEREAS
jgi:hypothetical protein